MHTKRIIPCLDVRNGKVVKGINFVGIKEVGNPVELGEYYYKQGADEIVFLDITATHEGRGIMESVVQQVAERIFIPFTVGGGLKDIDDIKRILRAGADKVSLNSSAVKNKKIIMKTLELEKEPILFSTVTKVGRADVISLIDSFFNMGG